MNMTHIDKTYVNTAKPQILAKLADIYHSQTRKSFQHDFGVHDIILYWTEQQDIRSFLCFTQHEDCLTLRGFTHKNHENKGYFSNLYRFAMHIKEQLYPGLQDIPSILSDGTTLPLDKRALPLEIKTMDDSNKIKHLAEKFDWTLSQSNLFFQKDLTKLQIDTSSNSRSKYRYKYLRREDEGTRHYHVFCRNKKIAKFSLSDIEELGERTVYFHSFKVMRKHRHLGHATRIMYEVMQKLQKEYDFIYLHVFADNTPAIKLYQNIGFEIADCYDYYEGMI